MDFSLQIPSEVRKALIWAARAHQWLLDSGKAGPGTFPVHFIPTSIEKKNAGAFNVFLSDDRSTYIWMEPGSHDMPAFVVLHYVGKSGRDEVKNWSTDEQLNELQALDPKPKE